jgi:selenocysteine lyase/cysteine desulfurase
VIAISWVQFATGYRADLAALAQIAHAANALLVVDVIQALGAIPTDLDALGVDMAATGSQKWLMGPLGIGGLYISQNALRHLRMVNMGAGSVKNVLAFDPLGFDIKENAQRFEEGTPNLLGAVGLAAAIDLLGSIGSDEIARRVFNVTRYAMDKLEEKGYRVLSPQGDDERAGIILFSHPTISNDSILDALAAAKINNVSRLGRVRFAPHFYNNEEDIDRAVTALP